jgi:cell division protein FtsN
MGLVLVLSGCSEEHFDAEAYAQAERNALEAELAEQEMSSEWYAAVKTEQDKKKHTEKLYASNSSASSSSASSRSASNRSASKKTGKEITVRKQSATHPNEKKQDIKREIAMDEKRGRIEQKVLAKQQKVTIPQSQAKLMAQRAPARFIKDKSLYVVQIGAFRVKENAERYYRKLQEEGFPVILQTLNHSTQGSLYLVRMQPTADRVQADSWASELMTKASIASQMIVLSGEN